MKDKTPDIFKSHHINENITLYSEVYFNINSIQDVKNIWKTYYKNQKFYKLPEVIIKVDASILTSRFTTNIKNYIPNFNFKLFSCFNTSNEKKFLYIGITDKSICTSSNLEIIFEGITNYFEQFTDLRNKISKEYPPVYKKLPNKKNSLIEEKSNKEYSPYFERTRRERSP